jgi:hypothetical protein
VHVASSVEQWHQCLLLHRQLHIRRLEARAVEREHDVKGRNLLLDQSPLVDAPRPFEQERLRVDADEKVLFVRHHVGLE